MRQLVPIALSAAFATSAAVLWMENRRLREEVAAARHERAHAHASAPGPVDDTAAPEPGPRRRPPGGAALIAAVGGVLSAPPTPEASGGPAPEGPPLDPQTRRQRREKRIRDLLGRAPGESDEQYRARVTPVLEIALWRPRQRVEEQRREFEAAAELTEAQRGELDRALSDARADLVELASKAVADGELTPYRRNSLGLLTFAGGAAGIADAFDVRLRQVLGPEQLGLLDQTGFDIIEYLGFTTPWERVTPPPPAPKL